MKHLKRLVFPIIIVSYALLYMATKKEVPCDGRCNKVYRIDTLLAKNRNYLLYVGNCRSGEAPNDTLCVYVNKMAGFNWDLLADTTCQIASQVGLPGQTILILTAGSSSSADTLVKRHCP